MIQRLKQWLNEKPIDSPRDEFTHRFAGALCKPTFKCTVCDSEVVFYEAELDPFVRRVEYRCPSCLTEGYWLTKFGNRDRTELGNVYPISWRGNPYDTLD